MSMEKILLYLYFFSFFFGGKCFKSTFLFLGNQKYGKYRSKRGKVSYPMAWRI